VQVERLGSRCSDAELFRHVQILEALTGGERPRERVNQDCHIPLKRQGAQTDGGTGSPPGSERKEVEVLALHVDFRPAQEPLRVEVQGVVPRFRVPTDGVRMHEEAGACRDEVSRQLAILR